MHPWLQCKLCAGDIGVALTPSGDGLPHLATITTTTAITTTTTTMTTTTKEIHCNCQLFIKTIIDTIIHSRLADSLRFSLFRF